MTREQALNYLVSSGLTEEQVMEVVEALRQEPCEDAVSRQAVEKITWEEPSYTDALNVLTEVREKIRQLPSVKSNVNVDALINKIETDFSWSMYDDWGNSTDLHDGLVDIIREWAE